MLLAIDIGNTNTVAGVFEEDKLLATVRLVSQSEDPLLYLVSPLWSWYREVVKDDEVPPEVTVASVVPELTEAFLIFLRSNLALEPLFISSRLKLPIKIDFDDPEQVGADRICNAVAAHTLHQKEHLPLVVVDFGTATTFDILSVSGDYIGGIICPGPRTAVSNLAVQAAQLFDVEVEPPSGGVIAKNTEDAIKSGMFYGTLGEIEYLIGKIGEELGAKPTVIASGGLANTIANHSKLFDKVDPDLTLNGIRLIHEYQSS